tara:strand:+ start:107 stop:232 length:126 start_codon:yes stop_codon:yes gene_type:complete
MNSNIFMNDSFEVKKKPIYEGVERNRDFEIKSKPKKKKKQK